jgi:hypothetical protein
MSNLVTIAGEHLSKICGGGAWDTAKHYASRAVNVVKETLGYAGPAGSSEAASALEPAANAALLKPQGDARNDLIRKLASEGSGRAADKAFDRYHNGPGQRLAQEVAK